MSLLNILQFPDKRLNLVADPVSEITEEIKNIAKSMLETMYGAHGVGLAAIQVNIQKRIIVIDVSEKSDQPLILINPEITKESGEIIWEEGCLSFPGVYAKVKRSKEVTIKYLDLDSKKEVELSADGLLAVCIQHEIDHLNGIIFYDHLSKFKQQLMKEKIRKLKEKRL